MSVSYGANLGLMENANTGEVHDTALRQLLRGLDALVMPRVAGYLTNTPPGSPANGDTYIIGAAPTGAWAGQGSKVARYSSVAAAWEFYTPKAGWIFQYYASARESYRYTGSAWEIYYQEGTWTPALYGTTGSLGTYTASIASGTYTRIGRQVVASMQVALSDKGSWTGEVRVSGLPFAAGTGTTPASGSIGTHTNITYTAGDQQLGCYVQATESFLRLRTFKNAGTASNILDYATGLTSASSIVATAAYTA